ncbi:hypothetical protein BXZ70DRAFT_651321 [Cristinia sonorae]|uniref:DUF6534 domain-containing protein n=1 Tax=Cristinia sonorae TaxID=1940300 RepID=A0A8K0UDZ0_9AGAR|nr:hypothetical protein BXZ70DRAFT_651321 [Cristinia sonorae]
MSAPPELPPIPPIIAQLTGPLLLGHLFNWGLFGALSVQVYIYYLAFPKDRTLSKSIVAFTYTIELLQTVLSTRDAFRNFGTGWGNMIELDAVGWLWFSVPVLGSIISCLGQMFYAWRIWMLSKQYWTSIIIMVISLLQFSTGLYSGARAHLIGVFSKVQEETFKTTILWLGGTAICDIIIAGSMIYYLSRSKTGFRQTSELISKFIRVTVETGLICATFAILDLALFLAFKENNYHLAPSIALSKLYSNSLLAVFNARVGITGGRNGDTVAVMETSSSTAVRSGSSGGFGSSLIKPFKSKGLSTAHGTSTGGISVEISHVRDEESGIEMTDAKYRSSAELVQVPYSPVRHPYSGTSP